MGNKPNFLQIESSDDAKSESAGYFICPINEDRNKIMKILFI